MGALDERWNVLAHRFAPGMQLLDLGHRLVVPRDDDFLAPLGAGDVSGQMGLGLEQADGDGDHDGALGQIG
ncbi:MAG: hypothetical protein R3E52_12870 [Burkholderiaceae bacterium]